MKQRLWSLTGNQLVASAALGVVGLHLCLGLLKPQQAWITCVAWITMYALALVVTFMEYCKATPSARWRWRLVSINFTLAICGFLCILYAEYVVRFSPQAEWLNDLLRALRGLPFLLAVCTPEEMERRANRLLDILQVVLIAVVFLLLFTPGLLLKPVGLAPLQATLFNRYNYTQSVILALLALLAVFTAKTAESRHFHRVLALYLWIGVPTAMWTNHILINTWNVPPASVLFVPSDLCLLAYVIAVPFFRNRVGPREPSPKLVFLRLGAAVFLPLFALLAGMILAIAGNHPVLGVAAGLVSLALFGVRSAYGQLQLLSAQWELESANARLETLSQHDALTGLYNRRWFAEAFALEWKRSQRSSLPLSLLLIDVDYFKLFNDTRGHAEGDFCLRTVSSLLEAQLRRSNDALARYGGEEFVAMLPNTDIEGARQIADRMMQALTELGFSHPASPLGFVTVSIGGATWDGADTEMTSEQMFLFVDAALYEAKRRGRNCVRLGHFPAAVADA
jgi:diguanylate cyclase (GGDEF)-like protein